MCAFSKMKPLIFLLISGSFSLSLLHGQTSDEQALYSLIDQYSQTREQRDTVLLKQILVDDIDQLVSSGTWRRGIRTAVNGMMGSSKRNPGKRVLTVENIRFLTKKSGIVDARYEIQRTDGSVRKMWSTFIVVKQKGTWRIAAIRNMLPAG